MLSDFTGEAKMGLDEERNPLFTKGIGHGVPFLPRQHEAEVPDRNLVGVDRVGGRGFGSPVDEVSGELVAAEIEVDPPAVGAAGAGSQHIDVEGAGSLEIVDGDREMERGAFDRHARSFGERAGTRQGSLREMSTNRTSRMLVPLAALLVVTGGLAVWALSGFSDTEQPPSPAAPRVARPSVPSAAPSLPAGVEAPRDRQPTLPKPFKPLPLTSVPTLEDVEAAQEAFEDMSLRPIVARSAGEAFDLDVSRRLNEKALMLRAYVQTVRGAALGGVFDEARAEARLEDARQHMAMAVADLPVPSYVDDPDAAHAFRARMAERALAVLDDGNPNDPGDAGRPVEGR